MEGGIGADEVELLLAQRASYLGASRATRSG